MPITPLKRYNAAFRCIRNLTIIYQETLHRYLDTELSTGKHVMAAMTGEIDPALFCPSNPAPFYLRDEQHAKLADDLYVVDGCQLPVHRAVLCKHSSVFREAYGIQEEMEQVTVVPLGSFTVF